MISLNATLPYISYFPFRSADDPRRDARGKGIGSILHHELAHLDAARTTRFGWMLARAGGRALASWRRNTPIELSPSFERTLGALEPLLEGLALYVQLDFHADENEILLPNTITPRVESLAATRGASWHAFFHTILWEEVEECESLRQPPPRSSNQGLLRLLFLNQNGLGTEHYFVGYLWVKAAAGRLARACPKLARPAILYPLLTKILFDRSIILAQADAPAADAEDFLANIVAPLRDGSLAHLTSVDPANLDGDIPFDFLELEALIARGELQERDIAEAERFTASLDDASRDCAMELRAAAQVHLEPPRQFRIRSVEVTSDLRVKIKVAHEDGSEETIEIGLPGPLVDLALSQRNPRREINEEKTLEALQGFEATFVAFLDTLAKRNVPVEFASYTRVDWTGDSGYVLWPEIPTPIELPGKSTEPVEKWWLPYSIHGYQPDEIDSARKAFTLSPSARRQFASALPMTRERFDAREIATEYLAGDLVSDPVVRCALVSRRLPGIAWAHCAAFDEWAKVPLGWREFWELPEDVLGALDRMIDLPAFRASGVTAGDLFPRLPIASQ